MQVPKASDDAKALFASVVPDDPRVVVKPMFGNLGAFINGNMFAALFGPTIGVRLSNADRAELEASERTVPFGPEERPMGGYVGLPEYWNAEGDGDVARAQAWVARAYSYVATLPPKDRRDAARPERRQRFRGGRRSTDLERLHVSRDELS